MKKKFLLSIYSYRCMSIPYLVLLHWVSILLLHIPKPSVSCKTLTADIIQISFFCCYYCNVLNQIKLFFFLVCTNRAGVGASKCKKSCKDSLYKFFQSLRKTYCGITQLSAMQNKITAKLSGEALFSDWKQFHLQFQLLLIWIWEQY